MKKLSKRPLSIREILLWADAYHQATGRWPTQNSGPIAGAFRETWQAINRALYEGLRGLSGGSSLARLLAEHRGIRNQQDLPPLTTEQILAWADAHYARTGRWPTRKDGPIAGTSENWQNIEQTLFLGLRGFPPGSSIIRLLAEYRGARNRKALLPLMESDILSWADGYHTRTGRWPTSLSGPIPEAPGEKWMGIENALRLGLRGLSGGTSLAWLLAERRGAGKYYHTPPLTLAKVLAWADAHHQRTGRWPTVKAGPVAEAPEETWSGVNSALQRGLRSLPGGTSLARLLDAERGVRNPKNVPRLTREQILAWADAHHRRTGEWPTENSGPIADASGETWAAVNSSLRSGGRGLRRQTTLARLLARYRDRPHSREGRRLSYRRIVAWADAHFARTGRWPRDGDGPIAETPNETWSAVDNALRMGLRGLRPGSSLARLLARKRGVRNQADLPPLTVEQILTWADSHHDHTGRWPTTEAGQVHEEPGQTWKAVDAALRQGLRGHPGASSLARLLDEHRGTRHAKSRPALTEEQILVWAEEHFRRTGRWPVKKAGVIAGMAETWSAVDEALRRGRRGLPGGSSLAQLLHSARVAAQQTDRVISEGRGPDTANRASTSEGHSLEVLPGPSGFPVK